MDTFQRRLAALAAATPLGTGYTLGLWEAVPKYLLVHDRHLDEATEWETSFKFCGRRFRVRLSPGLVRRHKDSNKLAPIFPSAREDLIFRCLQEFNVAGFAQTTLLSFSPRKFVRRVGFDVPEIRRRLAKRGRHMTDAEIIESFHVLYTAHFSVESEGCKLESGYISNLFFEADGQSGFVDLNPLATEELLRFAVWPIDNSQLMQLRRPLARYLMVRLFNRFRQAEVVNNQLMLEGYHIRLSRIGTESGIQLEERRRDTLRRVRGALRELSEAGVLSKVQPWTETKQVARVGRTKQAAVVDVRFTLFPSWDTADRIAADNARMKKLRFAQGVDKPTGLELVTPVEITGPALVLR